MVLYPSFIWFALLLASVPLAYWMRRGPFYVTVWFGVVALFGLLLPPFGLHVDCVPTASASGGAIPTTSGGVTCTQYAIDDPYSGLVKTLSFAMFLTAFGVGAYLALVKEVGRWLLGRWR